MNVYDFDKTIYNGDSTIDFYKFSLKRKPLILLYLPKQILGLVLYSFKIIKKTEFKEYFFSFLNGIVSTELVEEFWNNNENKIFDWYKKQQKDDDIIISASPEFLLSPICKRIGVYNLIASKVDPKTGKFNSENCYGEEKVTRLLSEYNIKHINQFYSDSLSDLPLAKIAKQAFLIVNGEITNWR